ncbi:hypothetical protein FOA43_000926 [Brettanomyces nanus]|uniref:Complex I-B15 n=1 Tax=Eeniella nana TaxID=13502 RepID=A0A875S2P7_EENNA|nr:uncharacterized protein FOA43_000926 [Brettanomyces nanus]QPG73614.1 hypothetical protein FOA43_000926 [Brettanomyces nanus]
MAGHFGRHLLRVDREVEKFAFFRENLINWYRWNLKSAGIALFFLGVIPVGLGYIGYKYQTINQIAARRDKPVYNNNWIPRT